MGTLILLIFFCVTLLYPISFLLLSAFTSHSRFSIESFVLFLDNPRLMAALNASIGIAGATVLCSLVVGTIVAILMARYAFSGKRYFEQLLLWPLFLPPFVGVLGIRQIMGRFGALNSFADSLSLPTLDYLGSAQAFGIVVVQTLHFFPLVYLYVGSALSNFNRSFEEAAQTSGASVWTIYRRITLPLLTPSFLAAALLIFMGSFTDVGTPLLFEYRQMVPVVVMAMLTELKTSGAAYALVLVIAFISVILFLLTQQIEKNRGYEMFGRGSARRRPQNISSFYSSIVVLFLAGVVFFSLIPHVGVLLMAFGDKWFMTPLPEQFTMHHLTEVLIHPVALRSIGYSFFLSVCAMVVCAYLGFLLSWKITRGARRWRSIWETFSMIPLAIPGIVLAYGLVIGFAGTILDPRKNPTILLIAAYAIRKLPFMVRMLVSGLQYANIDLEDAARTVGASEKVLFRRIVVPLIKPQLFAGAILVFIGSFLEVSDSLLLAFEEKFFPIAKTLYALQSRPDGPPLACALALIVMVFISFALWSASRISGRRVSQLLQGGG